MKVAFVTPAYYPALMGASLYCQGLGKHLVSKGIDVTVHTNATPDMKKEEVVEGICVKRFYPKVIGMYYISQGMLSSVLKEDADVIHSHHYGYYPATAGLIAAKLKKLPHVFGPYYHPPLYGVKSFLATQAYHFTQGLPLIRLSEKVLPHTEYEKKLLIAVGADPYYIEILPNIVETSLFKPHKKEKIVLFVSTLMSEKGAHAALDIAEQVTSNRNDATFVFIGRINEKEIFEKVKRLSKNKKIKFLNNLSLQELIRWYARSLIFILPSKYEAFARVIAEAQSCGTVVIATKVGGIPEVLVDKKSGLMVEYGDWKKMKEYIEYLLDHPSKAKAMGKAGRLHVVQNFDTAAVGNKLVKIYEDLL